MRKKLLMILPGALVLTVYLGAAVLPALATSTSAPPAAGSGSSGGGSNTTNTIKILNPLRFGSIPEILKSIGSFLFGTAVSLLALVIIVGAFQIMTAGGNPDRVSRGRNTIVWALIGFGIIVLAGSAGTIIADILGGTAEPLDNVDVVPQTNVDGFRGVVETITLISRWMFGILMALGVVFIIYSGILYVVAQGNSERIDTARKILTFAIIGMVVGVLAGGASLLVQNVFNVGQSSVENIESREECRQFCADDARASDAEWKARCIQWCNTTDFE